jgi:hypothetical protein
MRAASGVRTVPCRRCQGRGQTQSVGSETCSGCGGAGKVLSVFVEEDLTLGTPEEIILAFELPSDFHPAHIHMNVAWPMLITVHDVPRGGATDGHVFYPHTLDEETREFCDVGELLRRRPITLACSYTGYVPSGFTPGTNFRLAATLENKS